ncbi:MAG: hypothetical protein EOM25_10330 [Deltaproteobacteria bacterium]|nr:hypothetical protein [Deltaproteobacteria bacterium]
MLRLAMIVFCCVGVFGLFTGPVWATPGPLSENRFLESAGSGDRPGKENPIKNPDRLYLFKSDLLLSVSGNIASKTLTKSWNKPKASDLKSWMSDTHEAMSMPLYGQSPNGKNDAGIVFSPVELASGRITSPTQDDVVCAHYYRDHDAVKPYVFFVDNPDVNSKAAGSFDFWSFNSESSFNNYYSIGLAVGDVDLKADENGEYNDEIVVAFHAWNQPGYGDFVVVCVLDKDLKYLAHSTSDSLLDYPTGKNSVTRPFISVTMGDYDNDQKSEIALGFRTADSHGSSQKYSISTFKMESGLTLKDSTIYSIDSSGQLNAVDMASGDFDGNGIEDIAVCISAMQKLDPYDMLPYTVYLLTFSTDSALKLKHRHAWHDSPSIYNCYGSVRGASITSGLFKYNPSSGYTTSRRQIAMSAIFLDVHATFYNNVVIFDVDKDCKPVFAKSVCSSETYFTYTNDTTILPGITAGNFKGLDSEILRDQIAFSWSENKKPKFAIYDVAEDFSLTQLYKGDFIPGSSQTTDQDLQSVPIIAADRDGKGYYLGAPVHLTIPAFLRANYIIQEPPKHLDYLPNENGTWDVVQVSRERGFYTSFADTRGTSLETTHQDTTDFSIGGSEQISAKQTLKGSLLMAKAGITTKESEKLAYDYNSVTSNLNGNYTSTQTSSLYKTDRDDYVQIQFSVIDIWRFPIYGLKDKDNKNCFYDVVMPGPVNASMDVWGCDIADYYQPAHENGNILSYPLTSAENFPVDLGNHTIVDVDGVSHELDSPMSGYTEQTWSAGSGMTSIEWASSQWKVKERSHTKKLNFNFDFQLGFQSESYVIVEEQKWYTNIDLSLNLDKSWSSTDYSKSLLSDTQDVSLYLPGDGDPDQAYVFRPTVYTTKDGVLKMAHAVDPTGSQQGVWWHRHYRGRPDPALNLPKKFHWTPDPKSPDYFGTWSLAKYRQDRSRMRGLFLLRNEPKDDQTERLFVASPPVAGDVIYVLTRVYNYSLDTDTGPFGVRFAYADYNATLYDAEPSLTKIGEASVANLGPMEQQEVYVKWDTSGLGGYEPGGSKDYVVYVTIDPDNEVEDEIHELWAEDQTPVPSFEGSEKDLASGKTFFRGSNNQGFWPWDNSFKIFSDASFPSGEPGRLTLVGIEVSPTPASEEYGENVYAGLPYRIHLDVHASNTDKSHGHILFEDNGRIFSVKRTFGFDQGENDFYCDWTPTTAGIHDLKAVVYDTANQHNASIIIPVEVREFGASNSSDDGGNCFIATAAFGSYQEEHVQVLRQFRDRFLTTNGLGRAFVGAYYDWSPSLAAAIDDNEFLRAVARTALLPVYGLALVGLEFGMGTILLSILGGLVFLWMMKRRVWLGVADKPWEI